MADPVTMALPAAAALIGRLFSEAIAAGDYDKAMALRRRAVAEFGDEILPELERIEAETIERSEFEKVQADPRLQSAQMTALDRLSAFTEPGLSPEDAAEQRAAMEAAGGVAARQADAAGQLAARRGLLRSGLTQALGQDMAESGAQTAADAATQLAADRRRQRLQAISSFGGMAGDIRGQDVGEQQTRAGAIDSLNRFNANMRYDAQKARNASALDKFNATLRLREGRVKALGNWADSYNQRGDRNRETGKDISAGVSKSIGSFGG